MGEMTLPDAAWRHWDGLDRLARVLGAEIGEARFVGGAVRDTLLGIDVADVDIATTHSPERVTGLLGEARIKVIPTGIAHGTVTAVIDGKPFEVTTLRRDVSTDGRRATVAFTDDWREDAARRDFTMNALYADPLTGKLFDYFDGLADLEDRRVRFIGDPLQRIAEDHLRILRFFRFLARFGDAPDPEGLNACTHRANDLMALSRERIADELLKLLVARDAVRVVALMVERRIFVPVLPEIGTAGASRLATLAHREAASGIAPDPIRRLAALLPDDPQIGGEIGARLKLSNARRRRLRAALEAEIDGDSRALAYRLGKEGATDRLLLHSHSDGEAAQALAPLQGWEVPRLPLSGGDLIARGIDKGPEVAKLLRAVEDRWIAEGFPASERTNAIADSVVDQALRSTSS
ncbi:CCA tRNA nucleotidyltransferase [Stakelama marina]|uniref:CCA tRNA nucleotidyltransferase n=1 Tax=Stakelama marina TaxID=2826939 RepID=A0A8T4I8K7_9SPHN|nr:CCA tRNA nucleotidyltransferase [Stakelama marina]MBR0551318.1 CCA tRNA nucleotidyltransferase [Stakelama marina]